MAINTRNITKLDDLMHGAVNERFNRCLSEVMDNVSDLTTNPKVKRKIVLTFTFIPKPDRTQADFQTDIKTVIAPQETLSQLILIARDDEGNVVAQEVTSQVPGQVDMKGNITPMPDVYKFAKPD